MSAYSKQQYRYQQRLKAAAGDLYSCARSFKLTHDQILERRQKRIFNTPAWKHSSGYVHAYIRGMLDSLWSQHYRLLSWGFVVDGKIMTVDEMQATWPADWYTRCEQSTEDDPGNGTHFYDDPDHSKRKPY